MDISQKNPDFYYNYSTDKHRYTWGLVKLSQYLEDIIISEILTLVGKDGEKTQKIQTYDQDFNHWTIEQTQPW